MHPNGILREQDVEMMVAADSFEPLVARIEAMVRAGRRMVLAVRVYGGLTLDVGARGRGVWCDVRSGKDVWCCAVLTGGVESVDSRIGLSFGADVYPGSGNETAAQAWQRYHSHQAIAASHFERRRDMTHVEISGGLPGRRYRREDQIVISDWNRDGVCTERTLGFDLEDGSW